jgi:hypothetical protein
MSINWGGIGDFFTGGLTDFDQQGSWDKWQFNPIGGGHDQQWGPSIGTQVGAYPGSQDFLNDYFQNEFGGSVSGMFGGSGTQQVGAPASSGYRSSSSAMPSLGDVTVPGYSAPGSGRIGSAYVDEGMGDMLAEAIIRQKYTPLQRTFSRKSYGSGGGSGGSSTGDAIKGLAGQAIGLVGDKILGSFA